VSSRSHNERADAFDPAGGVAAEETGVSLDGRVIVGVACPESMRGPAGPLIAERDRRSMSSGARGARDDAG